MGNKILRERLRGPALAAYYPRKSVTMADIQKEFKRYDLETWDEDEEYRLEGLQIAKLRGKGAPKKKRVADSEYIEIKAINDSLILYSKQKGKEKEMSYCCCVTRAIESIPCTSKNYIFITLSNCIFLQTTWRTALSFQIEEPPTTIFHSLATCKYKQCPKSEIQRSVVFRRFGMPPFIQIRYKKNKHQTLALERYGLAMPQPQEEVGLSSICSSHPSYAKRWSSHRLLTRLAKPMFPWHVTYGGILCSALQCLRTTPIAMVGSLPLISAIVMSHLYSQHAAGCFKMLYKSFAKTLTVILKLLISESEKPS